MELGFATQAVLNINDADPFDPNLLDDFEVPPDQFEEKGDLTLETVVVTPGDPLALPGQGPREGLLHVVTPVLVDVLRDPPKAPAGKPLPRHRYGRDPQHVDLRRAHRGSRDGPLRLRARDPPRSQASARAPRRGRRPRRRPGSRLPLRGRLRRRSRDADRPDLRRHAHRSQRLRRVRPRLRRQSGLDAGRRPELLVLRHGQRRHVQGSGEGQPRPRSRPEAVAAPLERRVPRPRRRGTRPARVEPRDRRRHRQQHPGLGQQRAAVLHRRSRECRHRRARQPRDHGARRGRLALLLLRSVPVHVRAPDDARQAGGRVRPRRGAHPAAARRGAVARVLEHGHRSPSGRLAADGGDRHHGVGGPRTVAGLRHHPRSRLLGRRELRRRARFRPRHLGGDAHVRGGARAGRDQMVRRRRPLPSRDARRRGSQSVGVRPSVLPAAEHGGGRKLRRPGRRRHGVPANLQDRLRPRVRRSRYVGAVRGAIRGRLRGLAPADGALLEFHAEPPAAARRAQRRVRAHAGVGLWLRAAGRGHAGGGDVAGARRAGSGAQSDGDERR